MKITLEHKIIGAAVMQIAEHKQFTAINSLLLNDERISNTFLINSGIAVLCKYASEPNRYNEYTFTFNKSLMETLDSLFEKYDKLYFGLVCVNDNEICCLSKDQFQQLLQYRKESAGNDENQYVILASIQERESFRAYVNAAGVRGQYAGKKLIIPRNAFPESIFS